MKKKRLFLICTSLVMAMLLAFAIGCGKDDDNNNDNNDDNNEFAPLLSTTEVTDISFTYATSGGNITDDRGFTVTAKGVCWSTNQSPTTKDNKTEDGTGAGIFASKLTGLAAGATYYVRAYASNSKGTGYGSTLSFTTKNAELPIIQTEIVSNITSDGATCGGIITSSQGDSITARGVVWSTSPNPTVALSTKTLNGVGIGSFTSKISGLAAGTIYYVRAYATNKVGTSYGNDMFFTTQGSESFSDPRDGNIYNFVVIGNQVWMAENLKYLPGVVGSGTGSTTNPHYYVYGYEGTNVSAAKATTNYSTYGVLYNWPAAKNACPTGWHLPSDAEWTQLTDYLGGESVAGGKMKETGTSHWKSPNADATNESGFSGLPGGFRNGYGFFYLIGYNGFWWSSSEYDTTTAWSRGLYYYDGNVYRFYDYKEIGLSVRCLRD